ncbi:MAG: GntR family transcriptional regulator [Chitinivibrionales bacterium]|nr:GntR family transcriptional regulator [Chitinivibrionales bacterium]
MVVTPFEKTLSYLEQAIAELKREDILVLPGTRAIAEHVGVSRHTVVKAIHHLCDRGVLHWEPKKRAVIRREEPLGTTPPPPFPESWNLVAKQLAADLLTVWEGVPHLPSLHRLRKYYHVSSKTMRRALEYLAGHNIIERQGRHFRSSVSALARTNGEIVLIGRSGFGDVLLPVGPHQNEILRVLDELCAKAGISLAPSTATWHGERFGLSEDWYTPETIKMRKRTVLGFVVMAVGLEMDLAPLIRALRVHDVPVSVIDENPITVPAILPRQRGAPLLWVRALDDRRAGFEMGRYLLSRGHRNVAFAADVEDAYAQLRLAGLRDAYADASGEVASFTGNPPLDRRASWKTVVPVSVGEISRRYVSLMNEQLKVPNRSGTTSRYSIADLQFFNGRLYGSWESTLIPIHLRQAPLFLEMLNDSSATAWVCKTHRLACAAVDFLTMLGIKIPRDKSILCFEDTPETIARRITAYSYHPGDTARNALSPVLGLTRPWLRKGSCVERVTRGSVIERSTAAQIT